MYKKINDSLRIFADTPTLFNNCEFRGKSLWRTTNIDLSSDLKNINIISRF